jgi:ABC-type sugar transport system permease subunit
MPMRPLGNEKRLAIAGYLFILPWLAGFLALKAWPLFYSLWLSFQNVKITTTGIKTLPAGLANYANALLADVQFTDQLATAVRNLVLSVPVILVFSLVIALLINYPMKLKGVFRTIFFLPVIITSGPVITELVSQGASTVPSIAKYGFYALIKENLSPTWAGPVTYLFDQIIMILWFSGVQILIFLAGLQKINTSMYEAARIDGASAWEIFWKVTLPELRPLIVVNAVFTIVTLATFPGNDVMKTMQEAMFKVGQGFGYAAALSWIHFIVIALALGAATLIIGTGRTRPRRGHHA